MVTHWIAKQEVLGLISGRGQEKIMDEISDERD